MQVTLDEIWKVALRKLLPQYVQFFFPRHYDKVDWNKEALFLDKELHTIQPNSRPKNRIADLLAMLHLKSGKRMCIFLHIEVQGYYDRTFRQRVHQMRYRIEDKFGVNPVILCIFTDSDPNFHPKEYRVSTWGTTVKTTFNTYKVIEHKPSSYKDPMNIVSLIMETVYNSTLMKAKSDDERMNMFLPIARKLYAYGYSKVEIETALTFIEGHINFENPNNYRIFEQKLVSMEKYQSVDELVAAFDSADEIIVENPWLKKALRAEAKAWKLMDEEARKAKIAEQEEMLRQHEEEMKKDLYDYMVKAVDKKLDRMEREREERERQERVRMEREREERESQEKERIEREREERERQERVRSVLYMISQGTSVETVARVLNTPVENIIVIQEKYKDNNPIADILKG